MKLEDISWCFQCVCHNFDKREDLRFYLCGNDRNQGHFHCTKWSNSGTFGMSWNCIACEISLPMKFHQPFGWNIMEVQGGNDRFRVVMRLHLTLPPKVVLPIVGRPEFWTPKSFLRGSTLTKKKELVWFHVVRSKKIRGANKNKPILKFTHWFNLFALLTICSYQWRFQNCISTMNGGALPELVVFPPKTAVFLPSTLQTRCFLVQWIFHSKSLKKTLKKFLVITGGDFGEGEGSVGP